MGDLPGRKRQPDQALIDLFRDYGGGQAGREGCPQGAVEQALRLIRVCEIGLEGMVSEAPRTRPTARADRPIGSK